MSGTSNVGNSQVYEAKDQRTSKNMDDIADKFTEGKIGSHKSDDPSTFPFIIPPFSSLSFTHYIPLILPSPPSPASRAPANASLLLPPEDERSIANRLENESKHGDKDEEKSKEDELREQDATLPAKSHGNKPSKGAIIDQQIREEEEEILKKKGSFGPSGN